MATQTPANPPAGAPSAPIDLRVARRRRGLSISRAAGSMGLDRWILSGAEHGRTPQAHNQLKIADFYGLDVVVQWPDPDPNEEAA